MRKKRRSDRPHQNEASLVVSPPRTNRWASVHDSSPPHALEWCTAMVRVSAAGGRRRATESERHRECTAVRHAQASCGGGRDAVRRRAACEMSQLAGPAATAGACSATTTTRRSAVQFILPSSGVQIYYLQVLKLET